MVAEPTKRAKEMSQVSEHAGPSSSVGRGRVTGTALRREVDTPARELRADRGVLRISEGLHLPLYFHGTACSALERTV